MSRVISVSSLGPSNRPACVVRIRFVLRFMI
jgi:hypothetical protein